MASKFSSSMLTRSKATAISKAHQDKEQSPAQHVSIPILPRSSKPNPRKRKKPALLDEYPDSFDQTPMIPESVSPKKQEKRLRRFRDKPPQSFLLKLERALSQRMFVIGRSRGGTNEVPEEAIEMAGSTGNIYSVHIGLSPSCTCPDHQKGNQCKHLIYVLHNVLKAPEYLQYQLAFLSTELQEIFARAPLPELVSASSTSPSNRKEIAGDCPICFTEFELESDEIVWCKAACGNNIHKHCFEEWARSQKRNADIKCVFCRTPWQDDEYNIENVKAKGGLNEEGYVNIGSYFGLSRIRDTSTYHQPWVRQNSFGHL